MKHTTREIIARKMIAAMVWPHFIFDLVRDRLVISWHWSKPACSLCKHRHAYKFRGLDGLACSIRNGQASGRCTRYVPGKGTVCNDRCGIFHERAQCPKCGTIRRADPDKPFECLCTGRE